MSVAGLGVEVPVNEDCDGSKTDIESDNAVSHKNPSADQVVVSSSWWLFHDIKIWWVETKSSSWWSISDKVNPK